MERASLPARERVVLAGRDARSAGDLIRSELEWRMTARTGFLGLSHLGIVMSAAWASRVGPALAVDPDARTTERLRARDLPIHEPGLPELIDDSADCLRYSSDLAELAECPFVVITRDVPTDDDNRADLAPVRDLVRAALPHLRQEVTLALMSQVPPGFTRQLASEIRLARPDLRFQLFYWVETLIFGDAVRRGLEPERFILGCERPEIGLPELLREGLEAFDCPVLPMSYESAELTKMAINLYLVGSVTYANMLADLCEAVGADWSEMVPALKLDRRIGPAAYLRPSLGVAGGNLERDLITLKRLGCAHHAETPYLDALIQSNEHRFQWVERQLDCHVYSRISQPRLAIWGLTYKKDTCSTKNSPALRLIDSARRRAWIQGWDPVIGPNDLQCPIELAASRDDALFEADALIIMADWDAFSVVDFDTLRARMRRPVIIDCAGALAHRRPEMTGIDYVTMGVGISPSRVR